MPKDWALLKKSSEEPQESLVRRETNMDSESVNLKGNREHAADHE